MARSEEMSTTNPSTQVNDTPSGSWAAQFAKYLRQPVEALAFWAAVALPFVYLPLLFRGFDSATGAVTFLGLLLANFVALYLGHDHRRD
jgi:hypothetical protein